MNSNVEQTLKYYCNIKLASFKQSKLFLELLDLANRLDYCVNADCFCHHDKHGIINYYLWFNIEDKIGNPILTEVYYEYDELGDLTCIISVDKKERVKFFDWDDDDFIGSANRALNELKKQTIAIR